MPLPTRPNRNQLADLFKQVREGDMNVAEAINYILRAFDQFYDYFNTIKFGGSPPISSPVPLDQLTPQIEDIERAMFGMPLSPQRDAIVAITRVLKTIRNHLTNA